ncbi:MAG: hypothetical protein EA414_15310 [Arthrospira sp. PLM2.Bin9]|nr:pentapeptide repeat-containing protein [Arthrospira sp. PLM2.Bin9]TVU52874.1 MAG: hypothetical protein EA414_15310 [Arthrospira sp. PLM2.Bin9]
MRLIKIALCVLLLTVFMLCSSLSVLQAANGQPEPTLLTLELLQERLNNPSNIEGVAAINLQHLIIDIRPENAEFRNQFYRLLQTTLNQSTKPLGLDLSYSQIQGDFNGGKLGVIVPLIEETIQSVFSQEEVEQIKSKLAHLLIVKSPQSSSTYLPKLTVWRGRLKLEETQFQGKVDFHNTFFLKGVDSRSANFQKTANLSDCRFSLFANFGGASFRESVNFQRSYFITSAQFKQADFEGLTDFQGSHFQGGNFSKVRFHGAADFDKTVWDESTDFSESWWSDRGSFTKSIFNASVSFNQSRFSGSMDFRDTRFSENLNLREASIEGLMDFSDVGFNKGKMLNIDHFMFDSKSAQIMGDPGIIGQFITVPTLQGNENLLRKLIRNFREQEQIVDANYIEFLRAKLRLNTLWGRIFGVNINTASASRLVAIGFEPKQAETIVRVREEQPFRNLVEILRLEGINLATYIKVYNRAIANSKEATIADNYSSCWQRFLRITHLKYGVEKLLTIQQWLQLEILLLLTGYGTNFPLIFGVGIVAIAYFGLLFWLVDRVRRWRPSPILPTALETTWMLGSYAIFTAIGLLEIFSASTQPGLTLLCLGVFLLPIPGLILGIIYRRGRYHNLLNTSYLTEDGSLRQLRLMIGRLPIMPRYPLFRERYLPILWDRRWNWLNYYDFSLNNLLKFGFNDLRMRDEFIPGLVTTLVWYQWSLGVLYLILLLWTLSRTIPGLNLLIYLK